MWMSVQDDEIDEQFSINIWCKFYWILKHSNMVLNVDQIVEAVGVALANLQGIAQDPDIFSSASHRFSVT